MRRPATGLLALSIAFAAPLLAACAGSSEDTVTVSAAASLTDAFTEVADAFEAENPGTDISLNFGGSSALAEQVTSGAPVDVLATASRDTMTSVVDAGYGEDAATFATNSVTIAVPTGNPAGITSLADLAGAGVRVAECAPEVPCGAAAQATLTNAKVSVTPVTLDPDVRTVLGRVTAGEVDAGLVYVTDTRTADVDEVAIPSDIAASTDYVITVINRSERQGGGRAFVDFVLGEQGQRILADHGFGPA